MASRKEQKEKLREERLAREAEAAAAAARKRRAGYAVAGVLVAAIVAAIAVIALGSGGDSGSSGKSASSGGWPSGSVPKRKIEDLDKAVAAAGCKLSSPKAVEGAHSQKQQNYKPQPPTSGGHSPTLASDEANLKSPGNERMVHALEHGRVIFWFKPNASDKVRGGMKALYDEDKTLLILTPNEDPMPWEVAATSWGKLLGCATYNDKVPDALRAFRDAYRLKGPEYQPNPE